MTPVAFRFQLADLTATQPIRSGRRVMLRMVVQLSLVGQTMRNNFSGVGEAQDDSQGEKSQVVPGREAHGV